jgi:hypothetical protein
MLKKFATSFISNYSYSKYDKFQINSLRLQLQVTPIRFGIQLGSVVPPLKA